MSIWNDTGTASFQAACGFAALHPFADGALSFPHEFGEVGYGFHAVGNVAQHGFIFAFLGWLTMDIRAAQGFVGGEVPEEVRPMRGRSPVNFPYGGNRENGENLPVGR